MVQHRAVGPKGMLCPGTDIDLIDKLWPESLAYFSRVHLERCYTETLRGQTDTKTNHACAKQAGP